ncbi:T9SS type A sorting domain-containing protein [Hymenobacter sp. CRA2]|uniref:T9SS type A sorting domain-containing protein n=1 Tax=Hymenobacter sp. CRA2 TaxID=1955620 RepID=UPI00098F1F67|nr:T9SS type A sorting domain-containing protein [Hymenobacter sp. CRA2]OON71049.1 hypothetical protein B0919_03395 [Hymenobacter sp. CRA2]
MKAFYGSIGFLGLSLTGMAQNMTINGAQLTVSSGAVLYVDGAVTNTAGSTLTNEGTLQLGGNFVNQGTVSGNGSVVFSGTTNQTLTPGGATLYRVVVSKPTAGQDTLIVPADLTISNQLSFTKGMVRTPASVVITLPNGATVQGEAAGQYVQGNLRVVRTAVSGASVFDFGNGLALTPGANNLGQVTVTRTAGLRRADVSYGTNPNNAAFKGIDRIWTVQAAQQPTSEVPLTLTWVADNDNGLTNFSNAQLWQKTAANASWLPVGGPADASASRSITANASSLSGSFTVSNAANPLPVELVDFTAERVGKDALLRWTTALEKDNDRFEVEASVDGRAFRRIGTVAGQGTTTHRTDYELTDLGIARYGASVIYYRLHQVDRSGTASYSPVRTVRVDERSELVQAAPNPFHDELTVRLTLATAGQVSLHVHDTAGRLLLQQQANAAAGASTMTLEGAGKLPIGLYFLTVTTPQGKSTVKLTRE